MNTSKIRGIFILVTIQIFCGQICLAQNVSSSEFRNFTIARKDSQIINFNKDYLRNSLQIVYLIDSLPSPKWLTVTQQKFHRFVVPPGSNHDTIVDCNVWIDKTSVSELNLIYIFNNTEYQRNISVFEYGWCDSPQIAIVQQAKDELGNWKDIKDNTMKTFKNPTEKFVLKSKQSIYVLFKFPAGGFQTEYRLKMLIGTSPNFPKNQYIYSDTYQVKIDRSSLINSNNQE
ncbi:MAG: hypothetical protein IPN13_09915 [Bacteroidetes bacterium]|nr:hypothetical protein [Bacteroidota bacterium]